MQIDILTSEEKKRLEELLHAQHIVVCCHKSPDGDALGASLAFTAFLKALGKEDVTLAVPDAFPDFLRWQPNIEKVLRHDRQTEAVEQAFERADLIFCLDFNALTRIDEMAKAFSASQATKVMIDHHLNPTLEADLAISHPDASSTSELVFRIIYQLGYFELLDKKMAATIYSGMMCDTGAFTYNSNRPEIFFIISLLLTKGINKDKIYRNVFNNYSSWAIRLRGYLMSQRLNYFDDLHACYYTLTKEDMLRYHYVRGDQEGLVNEPLRIKGTKLSIALREDDRHEHTIWVSLRSVDDFPCNEMAGEFFNGGGHKNASGGRLSCSLEEAEQITRNAIKAYEHLLKK